MSLKTSASESEEKYVNEFMFAGKRCWTDCGVENCAVRFVILLMKNVSKSSALRVDEGGGGGGQMEGEKCFKEHARIRRIFNFIYGLIFKIVYSAHFATIYPL